MSSFLRQKNVLCVFSFRAVKKKEKKKSLSVEIIQILLFVFLFRLILKKKKKYFFSSFQVLVLREAKVDASQWIL